MTCADRIVPGLPSFLQLVAPEGFVRHEIVIESLTPPSMNTDEVRHWRAFARNKRDWQERIQGELMIARAPKDSQRVIAGAYLRFPRLGRRDAGNYATLLDKALGDALTFSGDRNRPPNLRYIADDAPEFYFFAGVEFEVESGPKRTRLVLFFQPKEES